jgi:pimeloyl-ACP methyl ester carboxylesterase
MAVPLLILHDTGDREVAFDEGVELADRWPGATLRRTEGLGHLRLLRDPASIEAATDFLVDRATVAGKASAYSTATRKNFTSLSSFTSRR